MGSHSCIHSSLPCLISAADNAIGIARLAAQQILGRFDELPQHQLGVAENRIIRGVLLIDIAFVIGCVDDHLARRNAAAVILCLVRLVPMAEDHIGLLQESVHRPRHHPGAGAERKRMVFGKRTFAFQSRHTGICRSSASASNSSVASAYNTPCPAMIIGLLACNNTLAASAMSRGLAPLVVRFHRRVVHRAGKIFHARCRREFRPSPVPDGPFLDR